MEKALIGRQPIYRDGVEVFGYELCSAASELDRAAFAGHDLVIAENLLEEFIDGVDRVVGPRTAFFDVSRDFILSEHCSTLPRNGMVLQVAAGTGVDAAFTGAVSRLARADYSIALNNFVYRDELRPLAEAAEVVKLDIRSLDRDSLPRQIEALRPFGMKLLAEGVDTYEDFEYCRNLGFEYFQGFFFCEPRPSQDLSLPSNRLSTLHLLSKLQDPDIDIQQLEQAVGQDVAMSYRILRYLNSPLHAMPRRIESLRHAILLVGTGVIRQWASVIWLQSVEQKPRELMILAMIRAHMCRQLGAALGSRNGDQFFTVGLFSLLDALLDRPMATVLKQLPLIDPIKDALLNRTGGMGAALNCVQAYERCDWDRASCLNLDGQKIREAYLSSVMWSRAVLQDLVN
jgi:c-di-GMP phosphodiesterase